jgi:Protein of unknown function (DUF2889)
MANDLIALGAGYRRRILIETTAGQATARLEDDYHHMVVTLVHEGGVVTVVESAMIRAPWTGCPGAIQRVQDTFTGVALTDVARRGEKTTNCTHLHDLALFAAAHADAAGTVAYDIHCSLSHDGSLQGRRTSRLWRNGEEILNWVLDGVTFAAPSTLAGSTLAELGGLIASQDKAGAEAIRILRWAAIVAQGRMMDIPANIPATVFPAGSCYNFQPERAAQSFRRPGADVDFSRPGMEPLAMRSDAFGLTNPL